MTYAEDASGLCTDRVWLSQESQQAEIGQELRVSPLK